MDILMIPADLRGLYRRSETGGVEIREYTGSRGSYDWEEAFKENGDDIWYLKDLIDRIARLEAGREPVGGVSANGEKVCPACRERNSHAADCKVPEMHAELDERIAKALSRNYPIDHLMVEVVDKYSQ